MAADILAFGAHADDVEIGCGATLADAVLRGRRVGIVDLTRGEMGTRGTPETRRVESLAAIAELGVHFREQLDFGDGNLRTGREEELELIRVIREHRPQVILSPWPDDRHPDHTRTGKLLTDAWFYAGLRKIDTGQKPHRPQAVLYYIQNYMIAPSFVVDVTKAWPMKMKSLEAYASQFYNPESTEPATWIASKAFQELIEARGRHFGGLIGASWGEAFVTKQPPRVEDLVGAYAGREI